MAGRMTLWLPTLAIAFFVFVCGSVPAPSSELLTGERREAELQSEALRKVSDRHRNVSKVMEDEFTHYFYNIEKRLAEMDIARDQAAKIAREQLAAKLAAITGKRSAEKRIAQSIVTGAKAGRIQDAARQDAIDNILEKLGKRSAELSVGEDWADEARLAFLENLLSDVSGKRKRLAEVDIGSARGNAQANDALRGLVAGLEG
ncbi:hypothetical protein Bbelb_096120 [Branchiostoma belcheri]|nr:hypothetical protein Bbelb_096120 [Branchiostoma belcheri]